jgi:carbon starvation protein CstA
MLDAALSLMMLAAIALVAGALFLFRRGERQRPVLMLVLAAIMVVNLVIWTAPTQQGTTLVEEAKK